MEKLDNSTEEWANKQPVYDLNVNALEQNEKAAQTLISLYWDKIFFNEHIKSTWYYSNEYPYPLCYKDKHFRTRLHYYYYYCLDKKERHLVFEEGHTDDLKKAFARAKKLDKYKLNIFRRNLMEEACFVQLRQNWDFMRRLYKTGEYIYLVYVDFNDGFFGTGQKGQGYNHLGKILMNMRTLLMDKENLGFQLFSGDWAHPNLSYDRGMINGLKQYVASEFAQRGYVANLNENLHCKYNESFSEVKVRQFLESICIHNEFVKQQDKGKTKRKIKVNLGGIMENYANSRQKTRA